MRPPQTPQVSEPDVSLRAFLREWRRETAKQRSVPAYLVMHDTTLDEICRVRPQSIEALLQVTGIGERKADSYGQSILDALKRFHDDGRANVASRGWTLE